MELSIIIASFNTRHLLEECLRSIEASGAPAGGCETIVVDNASTDGSQELVREQFPGVALIANSRNLGYAAANNQGARQASGHYLLFLNSDTVLGRDALARPLEYLRQRPELGALTVRLRYPNGQRDPDNHRGFPTPWNAFCHFSGLDRVFPDRPLFNGYFLSYRDLDQIHTVDVVAGSYLMMPRELFMRLGGWDESYFFYGEDIDLCYRIHLAGRQIVYFPEVEVLHYKGASSGLRKESAGLARPAKEARVRAARESIRAMQVFYRKFYQSRYPWPVTALVLTGIRLRGWLRIMRHSLT